MYVCVCALAGFMLAVKQNALQEDGPTVADSTSVSVCDSDTLYGYGKNRNTACVCLSEGGFL